jgi:hypothetical protein
MLPQRIYSSFLYHKDYFIIDSCGPGKSVKSIGHGAWRKVKKGKADKLM